MNLAPRTTDHLVVNRSVTVPRAELQYRYTTAGGPGGQHANRNRTRVELVFEVAVSSALTDAQKARVTRLLGARITTVGADGRSQSRNRELAERRLVEQLQGALHVPKSRRATAPTTGSRRRRLQQKRQRSEVKRARRRPGRDD